MRCLYCGNELALLKKLTGGGEFCSEAHRQKYQEEYNRLALSRLLQVQNVAGERSPLDSSSPNSSGGLDSSSAGLRPVDPRLNKKSPEAAAPNGAAPGASRSQGTPKEGARVPVAPPPEPEVLPAVPGFVVDRFEPVLFPGELFSSEPFLSPVSACLPRQPASGFLAGLAEHPTVPLPNLQGGWKSPPRSTEKQLDPREFSRSEPILGSIPRGSAPSNGLAIAVEPAEITLTILASATAVAWLSPAREFTATALFAVNAGSIEALVDEAAEPAGLGLPQFSGVPVGEPYEADRIEDRPALELTPEPFEPEVKSAVHFEPPPIQAVPPEPLPPAVSLPTPAVREPDIWRTPEPRREASLPVAAAPPSDPRPVVIIDLSLFEDVAPARREPPPPVEVPPVFEAPAPVLAQTHSEPDELPAAAIAHIAAQDPEPIPVIQSEPEPIAPPPQPKVPRHATGPLTVDVALTLPGAGKWTDMNEASATQEFRVNLPPIDSVPVRPKMVFAPPPPAVESQKAEAAPPAAERTPEPPKAAQFSKRDQRRGAPQSKPSFRPPQAKPAPKPPELVIAKPAEAQPAAPPVPPPMPDARPEIAALAAVEQAPAAPPISMSKPKVPAATPAPSRTSMRPSLDLDGLRLDLEQSTISVPAGSGWARMTMPKRLAVGAGLVLALGLGGLLLRSTFAKTEPVSSHATAPAAAGPNLSVAAGGWIADWTGVGPHGKQISLLRPSLTIPDYRIEFQAQIEGKSVGWIFRAADPKNYYGTRIEIIRPGLNPAVAVYHYTQIDGQLGQRVETPLPFPVHLDTVYKVRCDIYGSQFKTYIQGQLVDSWSDDRFKTGGFGLVTDRTERTQVRLLQLYELKPGK